MKVWLLFLLAIFVLAGRSARRGKPDKFWHVGVATAAVTWAMYSYRFL